MSCYTGPEIYDIGILQSCGVQELPLAPPNEGVYILDFKIGRMNHRFEIETLSPNQNIIFDFEQLPINREMILTVLNPITQKPITFDIEVNIGSECDPELVTKCFYIFKLKTNTFYHELY